MANFCTQKSNQETKSISFFAAMEKLVIVMAVASLCLIFLTEPNLSIRDYYFFFFFFFAVLSLLIKYWKFKVKN